MSQSKKVSVIVPVYNEEAVVADIVHSIIQERVADEIIVVDDGSSDQSAEIAKNAGAKVIRHPYNIGNGAAVKTGIRNAKGELLVFMDGDGQHDPKQIKGLVEKLNQYCMVVGARAGKDQAGLGRRLANFVYNRMATYVTKFQIKDLTSGFRAIRADVMRKYLYLLPNTFSYPTTITLALLRSGYPITYVPISTKSRVGKSKIKVLQDGTRFLLIILKICMLFSPLRIFLPLSAVFVFLSLCNYAYTYLMFHKFTNMSVLMAMMGVLVFMLGLIAEQVSMLRMDRSEHELDQ